MFDSIKSLYNEKLIKGRLEFEENLEIEECRGNCNYKIPCQTLNINFSLS
jgi:hypothetical protein